MHVDQLGCELHGINGSVGKLPLELDLERVARGVRVCYESLMEVFDIVS